MTGSVSVTVTIVEVPPPGSTGTMTVTESAKAVEAGIPTANAIAVQSTNSIPTSKTVNFFIVLVMFLQFRTLRQYLTTKHVHTVLLFIKFR